MTSYQIDNGNGDVASLGYRFRQRCTCLRSLVSRMKETNVDYKQTNKGLKGTGRKVDTEDLIIVAQDQSLATRCYHHRIINDGTNPLCRLCNNYDGSIEHILGGFPESAKTDYIKRHNNAEA